jgi:hypothetical protein
MCSTATVMSRIDARDRRRDSVDAACADAAVY